MTFICQFEHPKAKPCGEEFVTLTGLLIHIRFGHRNEGKDRRAFLDRMLKEALRQGL